MVPVSNFELVIAAVVALGVVVLIVLLRQRRRKSEQSSGEIGRDDKPATPVDRRRPGLRGGLLKTRQQFLSRLQDVLSGSADSERKLAELEEVLLAADVGVKTTQRLLEGLRARIRELDSGEALRDALKQQMRNVLESEPAGEPRERPHVILVAGVNGVGKTTTIAKLAMRYVAAGKKVLLIAADTFRAAAAEQLQTWAERIGADCVKQQSGSDPSAVAFDGMAAGLAREADVIIVDTAGRLHVKQHLVEELRKIARTIKRQMSSAPHEILLVIDATTGQNALGQARVFQEALTLTGIILTKLDGTAKGGAAFAIRNELGVPIRYIGTGERAEDLEPFQASEFVEALFATTPEAP
ncbi:MAG: signal recognition particle-docking protein FtsY [Deltaproteobacteria bacterium]|nr:signal recognition particle-docking protein FtsY [Deltaproteobacteria bacterium]